MILRSLESCLRFSISGIPLPASHFVIACRDTKSFSANYSCVSPALFRADFNFSPNVIFVLSFFTIL